MRKNKFISDFEDKVKKTISGHKLLDKKEKIVIAASAGKDSTVILYLLKKWGYNVEALHINLGLGKYSERCLEKLREFCKNEGIKLHLVDIKKGFGMRMCNIRLRVQEEINVSNCMVCGIVKKWILNKEARKLKGKKIVTGHNLDDEAQTVIMNFLQGNLMLGANSGPRTGIVFDKKFIPRIKPLYFNSEKSIRKYSELKRFPVVYEKCPCAVSSLRIKTREFLENKEDKIKKRIVENFLKILPELKKKFEEEKIFYCEECGEPSRNTICKKCLLLNLKSKK